MPTVYLDNSATTPVCREAAEAALSVMTEQFGNPSSLHTLGFQAEQRLSAARKTVAELLRCQPNEITFTSGGTEANNLAVLGGFAARCRRGNHVVTTAVEHASVTAAVAELEQQGAEVTRLVPDADGRITPQQVAQACRPDTVLVSIMLVNNEIGARFPIEAITPTVRRLSPHALVHCDAVQAVGRIPLSMDKLGVDLLSGSAHKVYAPKGCGFLFCRRGVRIQPRLFGGGQENGLRPGTESVPLIAALDAAIQSLPSSAQQDAHYRQLQQHLLEGLQALPQVRLHQPAVGVPYITSLSVVGYKSETLLHFLAERGVYVSSGSACSKGAKSPVLTALGLPDEEIDSALRISFGRTNTIEDIDTFLDALQQAIQQLVHR